MEYTNEALPQIDGQARDVLATTLAYISPTGALLADVILADLTAAGWTLAPPGSRVVPEGGVDAETVERCAAEAMSWQKTADRLSRDPKFGSDQQLYHKMAADMARDIAAALRALAETKP